MSAYQNGASEEGLPFKLAGDTGQRRTASKLYWSIRVRNKCPYMHFFLFIVLLRLLFKF
jgi:hypothetical protein